MTNRFLSSNSNNLSTDLSNLSFSGRQIIQSLANTGGGAGEVNTGSNLAGGTVEVFKQKAGTNLEFRSLLQGTNITMTEDANNITINSTGGGGGATTLSDLTDTDIGTTPLNINDGLLWNGTDWENSPFGSAIQRNTGPAANQLTVNSASIAANSVMISSAGAQLATEPRLTAFNRNYDGNGVLDSTARSDHTHTLSQLTDTDIGTTPLNINDGLLWNGADWENSPFGSAIQRNTGPAANQLTVNSASIAANSVMISSAGAQLATEPRLTAFNRNYAGNGALNSTSRSDHTHTLSQLTDTLINVPANNEVLTYDNSDNKWKNSPATGGSIALDDITDVTIAGVAPGIPLSDGQYLAYDANDSVFRNINVPSASVPDISSGIITESNYGLTPANPHFSGMRYPFLVVGSISTSFMWVYNVSGVKAILINTINVTPSTNAQRLSVVDNYIFFGSSGVVYIYSFNDPLNVVFLSSFTVAGSASPQLKPLIYENHLFMSLSAGDFSIRDMTDPTTTLPVSTIPVHSVGSVYIGQYIKNDVLFLVANKTNDIRVISYNIANFATPVLIQDVQISNTGVSSDIFINVIRDLLLVTINTTEFLSITDISNPNAMLTTNHALGTSGTLAGIAIDTYYFNINFRYKITDRLTLPVQYANNFGTDKRTLLHHDNYIFSVRSNGELSRYILPSLNTVGVNTVGINCDSISTKQCYIDDRLYVKNKLIIPQRVTADQQNLVELGSIYIDKTDDNMKFYDGSAWKTVNTGVAFSLPTGANGQHLQLVDGTAIWTNIVTLGIDPKFEDIIADGGNYTPLFDGTETTQPICYDNGTEAPLILGVGSMAITEDGDGFPVVVNNTGDLRGVETNMSRLLLYEAYERLYKSVRRASLRTVNSDTNYSILNSKGLRLFGTHLNWVSVSPNGFGHTSPNTALGDINLIRFQEGTDLDTVYGSFKVGRDFAESSTQAYIKLGYTGLTNVAGNSRFKISYSISSPGSVFTQAEQEVIVATSGVLNSYNSFSFGVINCSTWTFSTAIYFTLRRQGSDVTDSYNGDLAFSDISLLYQADSIGSDSLLTKSS